MKNLCGSAVQKRTFCLASISSNSGFREVASGRLIQQTSQVCSILLPVYLVISSLVVSTVLCHCEHLISEEYLHALPCEIHSFAWLQAAVFPREVADGDIYESLTCIPYFIVSVLSRRRYLGCHCEHSVTEVAKTPPGFV